MMDSHDTNLPIQQGNLEEEKNVSQDSETQEIKNGAEDKAVEQVEPALKPTKKSILKRLNELANDPENSTKSELDSLKQTFYKLHNAEIEANKKEFVESGAKEEDYVPGNDEIENEFKNVMSVIKEKRNAQMAEVEKQKENNLDIKLSILAKLKDLIDSPQDTNKSYNEFKKLQKQWNEIKLVPQTRVNELWRNYQLYVEKFYDILKLNNEFRDYDFKKNLEIKTKLCEAAEKLIEEPDVISAFHQLQKLHQEFRDTGPVAKELRDEIWARFKAASTLINRSHQEHFEQLKESEQLNLDQKTVICEIVEAIEYSELTTFRTWETKTREIIALQSKWKTIGFAPRKMNVKIFDRFRKACDNFFKKKSDFYKTLKESMAENLEKKKVLCEKAEALKDSTEWKETAEALSKLQKEWKEVGPVVKKHSDAIWHRFIGACDYFFDQKNKATSSQRSSEVQNLEKKKEIINRLTSIKSTENSEEADILVRELIKEWNAIGHVPFKEKDHIYKQYHTLVDEIFDKLNISVSNRKLDNFKASITSQGNSQSLYKERERLIRTYENMKNELQTYENNLGFLSSSSQKGNSLLTEINRKVEKLKSDIELTQQKINAVNNSIKTEE